jgi:hypothetical protein
LGKQLNAKLKGYTTRRNSAKKLEFRKPYLQKYYTSHYVWYFCCVILSMAERTYQKIFADHHGILRAYTAIALGIPQHVLYRRVKDGELVREAPGIYRLTESEPLGNPDLVQISLRVPRSVICLVSGLYFHDLTTQIPHWVHFALPRNVKTPKIEYPPIKVFHFSPKPYQAGSRSIFLTVYLSKFMTAKKPLPIVSSSGNGSVPMLLLRRFGIISDNRARMSPC